jgi:hypothetical protein
VSTDARDDSYTVVDGAPTEDAAIEKASEWNAKGKFSDPFFYHTKPNPAFDENARPAPAEDDVVRRPKPSAPPKETPFVKLPSVDPGAYQPSKPKYPVDDPRSTEGAYNNPLVKNVLAGTAWDVKGTGGQEWIEFGDNGNLKWKSSDIYHGNREHKGAYKVDGETINISYSYANAGGGVTEMKFSGKLTSDAMKGTLTASTGAKVLYETPAGYVKKQ